MAAAAVALLIANSPWTAVYFEGLHAPFAGLDILDWINDGLMALFFLVVGLEIKREFMDGQLATWSNRALPGVAAAGGIIAPAVTYAVLNRSSPATLQGWAIPTATDIAFALGVLADRVPCPYQSEGVSDDLGHRRRYDGGADHRGFLHCGPEPGGARRCGSGDRLSDRNEPLKITHLAPYLLAGAALWGLVLLSGVHATVAGVILALCVPLKEAPGASDDLSSPLHRLEHALAPWVALLIVPVFGFANAGVSFAGMIPTTIFAPVTLGSPRLVPGQADWGLRRWMDRDTPQDRGSSCRGVLGAVLQRRTAMRHRFHHEPFHRLAGLPRSRPSGRGEDRGTAGIADVSGLRRRRALTGQAGTVKFPP